MKVEPAPTPEEAAAIVAALDVLREAALEPAATRRSHWKLAGSAAPWGGGQSSWSRWDREGY